MVSPRILELFLANARWLRGDRYDPKAKHRNVRPVLVHASARRELVIFEKGRSYRLKQTDGNRLGRFWGNTRKMDAAIRPNKMPTSRPE
jgi:hypothetical protein